MRSRALVNAVYMVCGRCRAPRVPLGAGCPGRPLTGGVAPGLRSLAELEPAEGALHLLGEVGELLGGLGGGGGAARGLAGDGGDGLHVGGALLGGGGLLVGGGGDLLGLAEDALDDRDDVAEGVAGAVGGAEAGRDLRFWVGRGPRSPTRAAESLTRSAMARMPSTVSATRPWPLVATWAASREARVTSSAFLLTPMGVAAISCRAVATWAVVLVCSSAPRAIWRELAAN